MTESTSSLDPAGLGLDQYHISLTQLQYGEYEYEIEALGCFKRKDKSLPGLRKSQKTKDLRKIICALANTSGGVIHLITPSGQPITEKDYDKWVCDQKDQMQMFLPKNIYGKCLTVHRNVTDIYMIIQKSDVFITAFSHMYTRQLATTNSVSYKSEVEDILHQEGTTGCAIQIPEPCHVGDQCRLIETEGVELACYSCKTAVDLIDKLKTKRKLETILAMANLSTGGDLILGVEDHDSKGYVYTGQEMSKPEQNCFKNKLTELLREGDNGTKRIWSSPRIVPVEGRHWTCDFIPLLTDKCNQRCKRTGCIHQSSRVLVVIHINYCPGGVFEQKPESFIVNDDGHIEELSFQEWLHRHQKNPNKRHSKQCEHWPSLKVHAHVTSKRQTNMGQASTSTADPEKSSLKPDDVFESDTSLSFRRNSSLWKRCQLYHPNLDSNQILQGGDLFKVGFPVHYTPPREHIERVLSNKMILPTIDKEMGGAEAFGIAAERLYSCIGEPKGCKSRTLAAPCLKAAKKPKGHVMDLMVVKNIARIFLFIVCSMPKPGEEVVAYGMNLARILKKRILENMNSQGDCTKVNVSCTTLCLNGQRKQSPEYYFSWIHQPSTQDNFKFVCQALRSVLTQIPTFLTRTLVEDENLSLTMDQLDTLIGTDQSRFNVIEGPPGSGKTLLAQYICENSRSGEAAFISPSVAVTNKIKAAGNVDVFHARSPLDILELLKNQLKSSVDVVIDDAHMYTLNKVLCHQICSEFTGDRNLYIFQESKYQTFRTGLTFDTFLAENKDLYYPVLFKSLHVIRRNSQIVGSYIKAIASDISTPAILSRRNSIDTASTQIACQCSVEGDDVSWVHLPHLRLETKDNSLLKHVQQLVFSATVDANIPQYNLQDIAILVDHATEWDTARDIELFTNLFNTFWPESSVHSAEVYPAKGITIDNMHNFAGLEARVVVFILPEKTKLPSNGTTDTKSIANPKYKLAITSRAIDKIDFVQEDNLIVQDARSMKYDEFSKFRTVRRTDNSSHLRLVWETGLEADIRNLDFTPAGDVLCRTIKGVTWLNQNGKPCESPLKAGSIGPVWSAAVSRHTGHIAVAYHTANHEKRDQMMSSFTLFKCRFRHYSDSTQTHDLGKGEEPHVSWSYSLDSPESDIVAALKDASSKWQILKYNIRTAKVTWNRNTECWDISDIAVDSTNNTHCCDYMSDSIHVYDSKGAPNQRFILQAQGRRFSKPVSICLDSHDRLLVLHLEEADGKQTRSVTVWSREGHHLTDLVKDLPVEWRYYSSIRLFEDKLLVVSLKKTIRAYDVSEVLHSI